MNDTQFQPIWERIKKKQEEIFANSNPLPDLRHTTPKHIRDTMQWKRNNLHEVKTNKE